MLLYVMLVLYRPVNDDRREDILESMKDNLDFIKSAKGNEALIKILRKISGLIEQANIIGVPLTWYHFGSPLMANLKSLDNSDITTMLAQSKEIKKGSFDCADSIATIVADTLVVIADRRTNEVNSDAAKVAQLQAEMSDMRNQQSRNQAKNARPNNHSNQNPKQETRNCQRVGCNHPIKNWTPKNGYKICLECLIKGDKGEIEVPMKLKPQPDGKNTWGPRDKRGSAKLCRKILEDISTSSDVPEVVQNKAKAAIAANPAPAASDQSGASKRKFEASPGRGRGRGKGGRGKGGRGSGRGNQKADAKKAEASAKKAKHTRGSVSYYDEFNDMREQIEYEDHQGAEDLNQEAFGGIDEEAEPGTARHSPSSKLETDLNSLTDTEQRSDQMWKKSEAQ